MDDYTEGNMWVSCGEPASIRIYGTNARAGMQSIQKAMMHLAESDRNAEATKVQLSLLAGQISRLTYLIDTYDTDECPFEGDITVYWTGMVGKWTCPYCDHEHEVEGGEDPDDAYERWKDSRYE